MMGMVMVGAIISNKSPVNLSQVTPIARLTGEYQAVVVPANSNLQSMKDLVAQFKGRNPACRVRWWLAGRVCHLAGRRRRLR